MDFEEQHVVWKEQVKKLIQSNDQLKETDSTNILIHFFSQVVERDFCHELDSTKSKLKSVIRMAVQMAPTLMGDTRVRAATVLRKFANTEEPILDNIRLNDIRNIIVFEIFKQCGITIDTYFERYSSPPGTPEQSQIYLNIAHGQAMCTAIWTEKLSFIINTLNLLKMFFLVYDILVNINPHTDSSNLNWHCSKWSSVVQKQGLGDLVWNIFLDVWEYEHSSDVYK
jgi:hypothetical protein